MSHNNDILQELKELESTLADMAFQNVYTVPLGYFEGLAAQVLSRINAMTAETAADELMHLSPVLNNLSKQMPYFIPSSYFKGLEDKLMQSIRERDDYQTAQEELETLSPLLSGLSKKTPYSIPQGYLENLHTENNTATVRSVTKVVSISSRKWLRYAAAAVLTGAIALGSILYFTQKSNDPVKSFAKFEKKLDTEIKTTSEQELKEFVQQFSEAGLTGQEKVQINSKEETKDLLKDVPDKELKKFLEEMSDPDDEETTN